MRHQSRVKSKEEKAILKIEKEHEAEVNDANIADSEDPLPQDISEMIIKKYLKNEIAKAMANAKQN